MRFILFFSVLSYLAIAAPIYPRQGAGVGAGCDAIVSDADTMIGESSRGAGKSIAAMIPRLAVRQGAGVGAGCDAIVSDADTMIGESSRGAGKSIAAMIPDAKRQLNGIADGATAITAKVPGAGDFSTNMDSFLNTVDGQGTDDSAEFGQDIGAEEVEIGNTVGGSNGQNGGTAPPPQQGGGPPPKPNRRQLNGMADGATAITGKVPGAEDLSTNMDSFLNTVDGNGTDDSAEFGRDIGAEEVSIGDTVGGSNGQNGGTAPPPHN